MSWTHPESTERKLRTSDALAIQLPSSSPVSTISVSSYETQAAEVGEFNYAKLLQESLYFYDANM